MSFEPIVETAAIDRDLAAEFPELELRYCFVAGAAAPSPSALREQLGHLSNTVVGERAVNMRREPIAHAYRVFFRHIGIDPDETRVPVEAVVLDRLRGGRFASQNLVADAITVATLETGASLLALDTAAFDGPPLVRLSVSGEKLGSGELAPVLRPGTIVVADRSRPIAVLFGEADPEAFVGPSTEQVLLCALKVAGIPSIVIEDGLWKCGSIIVG